MPATAMELTGVLSRNLLEPTYTPALTFMPSSLSFLKIGSDSEAVLGNLFQHYLRDMAEWFEVETNPDGSYAHDISAIWVKGVETYLAKVDGSVAGFALVGSANEWLDEAGAHDVQEFFVLPRFRRNGVGQHLATHIWNEHSGAWVVRVLNANGIALAFWRAAIARYALGSPKEEARLVKGREWVFFRFTSAGSTAPPS